MRIALINSNPSWGGGERWFAEAACALLERGHEVLAVAREGSRLLERLTAVAHDAAPWEGAWARIVAPPTDVVLCNAPRDLRAVARVLPRARAPVLVLRRGIDRPLRGGFWRRRLWRRVAMVIVNSEASGRQVRRSLPWYPAERVVRIYNPVTLDPLPREPQGDRPPRLGAVGRLTHQKGFDVLIDAVAQLDEPPGLELWIAGEGRARAALERRIARRGLDTRCRL
ncbi:MAG: glycosyltransferase, partial [Planctomycetota bacterium]